MAILGFAGAETGDLAGLNYAQTGWSASTNFANGSYGAYSFRNDATQNNSNEILGTVDVGSLWFTCVILFTDVSTPASEVTYRFQPTRADYGAYNAIVDIVQKTDGTWELRVYNSAGSLVGSASITSPTANTWHRLDYWLTKGAGTGAIDVYWDDTTGSPKISLTSQQFGAANIGRAAFGQYYGPSGRVFYMDDLYLADAVTGSENVYAIVRQFKSGSPTYDTWTKASAGNISAEWSDTPFSATNYARSAIADSAQTGLIAALSSTQTGHGSGVVQSYDSLFAAAVAAVAKTAATTAAGITLVGTPLGGNTTDGTDVTISLSGMTPQAGDLIVVTGGHILRTGSSYGPSGYTAIGSLQTTGTSGGAASLGFGAWYKVSDGTETSVVSAGSGSTGDGSAYVVRVLRQVDTSNPIDVSATFAGPTAGTNPDPPASGTLVTNNCCIIAAAASTVADTNIGGASNYVNQASSNADATTRDFTTSQLQRILSGGAGGTENPPAIGSTGNSWSSGTWFAVTIAIRPASQAGSAMKLRHRLGGVDTDTAITLTTSDAYYRYGVGGSYSDLNSGELGALHGNNSLLQTVEDMWLHILFQPGTPPATAVLSKNLSMLGTRIGSRQAHRT